MVLPLILALLLAVAEVAVVARTQLELVNGAREGARVAAVSPEPSDAVAAVQEVLGEMALVTDEPRSATAVAVTQTKLRAYQVDELVKMLEENPGIAVRIIELLAERLRKTNQLLTEATTTAS